MRITRAARDPQVSMPESYPNESAGAGGKGRHIPRKIAYVGVLGMILNDIFILPTASSPLQDSEFGVVMFVVIVPGTMAAIIALVVLGLHQSWRQRIGTIALGLVLLFSAPLSILLVPLIPQASA